MKMRWAKRRLRTRGFVLAEALVSLTVAALTLALLTSATWGLRQTAMQPSALQQEATDWLTARRVLQAWAGSATVDGISGLESRFAGSPTQMRLVLDDGTSRDNRPIMISIDISQEDGLHRLTAARHFGVRDVRLGNEQARASTIIVSDEPLRLIYFVAARGNQIGRAWTYEPRIEQGLPAAIAIEQGSERMIVAQMPVTRSAQCVSRFGINGLGEQDCELR
jgi:hypothetical protein